MKKLVLIAGCLGLGGLVAVAGGEKKTTPKIEGKWTLVGGSADGKKGTPELIAQVMMAFTFKEGKFSVFAMGKEVAAGDYKMDAAKLPIQIDKRHTSGGDKGRTQVGILKLEGDTLTIAESREDGKIRPKNYDGGPEIYVHILKRSK